MNYLAQVINGKKLSHSILLHFSFGIDQISRDVSGPSRESFFHKGSLFKLTLIISKKIKKFWNKGLLEDPETPPDILRGSHMYPYQMENEIKLGGIVFFNIYQLD